MPMHRNQIYFFSNLLHRCFRAFKTCAKIGIAIALLTVVLEYCITWCESRWKDKDDEPEGEPTPEPDPNDTEAARLQYAIAEISRAIAMVGEHQVMEGLDHMVNAIEAHDTDVSGTLLQEFAEKLEPREFDLLAQRLIDRFPNKYKKETLIEMFGDLDIHSNCEDD